MKILVSVLCLEKAGSHVLALSLASALAARGHHITLFNQGEQLVDEGMVAQYLRPGIPVVGMDSYPRLNAVCWKLNGLLRRLGVKGSFHEWCKTLLLHYTVWQRGIELVHGHEILVAKSRLVALGRRRVPLVITDHGGYSMLVKMNDWSFTPYANLGRAIVAVSEYSCTLLLQGPIAAKMGDIALQQTGAKIISADFQAEATSLQNRMASLPTVRLTVPVRTIYNGVQARSTDSPTSAVVRQRLGISPRALVFGMIGRGTYQKGWEYALAAYVSLKQQVPDLATAFVCMGAGPVLSDLEAQLSSGHSDIHFLGGIDDPHAWMPACDIGVMTSCFSEGLPLSIIEFYGHGIPVIASELGGIPEIIAPKQGVPGGLLVQMKPDATPDEMQLLEHMLTYATEPALRKRHGLAAEQIAQKFGMNACADEYEAFFNQIAKQNK
jgi:glycosyltransferase involved in cell wall biosynthesis